MIKDAWNIAKRPHTRTKLRMLRKIFDIWLTIWNGPNQQKWVSKEWYILDLFAGRGWHEDKKKEISGSPLIFLEEIIKQEKKLENNNIKIKLFFVEIVKKYIIELQKKVSQLVESHPEIKNIVEIKFLNEDCNKINSGILKEIQNTPKHPIFLCIDPWGINIHKQTIKDYLNLNNPIDIFFNYSKEGETRTRGIAIKKSSIPKEIKTVSTLEEFLGKDVDYETKKDLDLLSDYIKTLFVKNGYNVVGFDMQYPSRKDIIYYLLFASKNETLANKIVKGIYAEEKENTLGLTLFGREFYLQNILFIPSKIRRIYRRSLLYKTKVEYGDWTINHITGCMHGCNFPCYAFRMAQKFGWVKDYSDWRRPKIATNALDILEGEIPKYKNEIKHFVHLCFMTDPFMYDFEEEELIPEIKELTLKIIERLNKEGIRVTTLTKGFYPNEILNKKRFLQTNEYGITLVSLNENFKKLYEPFSAPYKKRVDSLKKLAKAGLKTWVSMEPYPIPKYDETAENIENILEKIKFVQKIVFGKLNYRRLSACNGNGSQVWENSEDFYKEMARKVINFCEKNNIKYHIKLGTPLHKQNTVNIFKE
jgi:three-Cys-motif partner protein